MKQLHFRVIHDIETARDLWEQLTDGKTIDATWQFRYTFFKYLNYNIYFIAGYDGETLVGLLPLQYNASYGLQPPYAPRVSGFLEFFGSDDMDDNDVMLKPGYDMYRNQFFSQIDRQAVLAPVSEQYAQELYAEPYVFKYILPLKGYTSYEDYLNHRLDGDARRNLRRQIRLLHRDHTIEIVENEATDLDLLFDLSVKRFGGESSFRWPYRRQIFKDLKEQFQSVIMTIKVDGLKEAVGFGIIYNGTYLDMNAVANPDIPNLGKLLTLTQIDKALALGCHTFDAGKGDSGWKEQFRFIRIPQFKFTIQQFQQAQKHYNFLQ
jgi:hypothetical protein